MEREEYIQNVKRGSKGYGQADLLKHLAGKKITRHKAILAKCYECSGLGESKECDIDICPLYPYSLYKIRAGESPSAEEKI
jgi:hypothetical protein